MQGSVGWKWFDGKWLLRHLLVLWGRYRGDSVGGCWEPAFAWLPRFHYMKGSKKSGKLRHFQNQLTQGQVPCKCSIKSGYQISVICTSLFFATMSPVYLNKMQMDQEFTYVHHDTLTCLLLYRSLYWGWCFFCVYIRDFRGYVLVDTCQLSWPVDELHEEMISLSDL